MKKLLILAVAAIALVACSKTYEVGPQTQGMPITMNTWNDVMTKANKVAFMANDEFDVFGYKWNEGPANETTVFDGVDVKFDGTKWSYSPLRFWDSNFDHYTFYAVWPKDVLSASNAQTGIFTSKAQDFSSGTTEPLLIAQKKKVDKAAYGTPVELVFKHASSLLNVKVKKHPNLSDATVTVHYITFDSLRVSGTYTNKEYDTNNNPIGATVSEVDSLGWTPDLSGDPYDAYNDSTASPFRTLADVVLDAETDTTVTNAKSLVDSLIVMPQILKDSGSDKQQITITYSITTGTGGSAQTTTYERKTIDLAAFDHTDPGIDSDSDGNYDNNNTTPFISRWRPGVCYTYYITINANGIEFTASIDPWVTESVTGHHYILN